MKTLTTLILAFALQAAHAARAADWYAPQQPFVVYGDTYYVGTHGISAVLITSKAGHILIDVGGPDAARQVEDNIRQLGFRVEDIRYILNSHAHQDHAGAIAALQRASGAEVLAGPANVPVLRSGQPDRSDPQYPDLIPMAPIVRTRALRDGEVVRLGPLAVSAHFTPGHTKGGVSYTWQATEGGRTVDMVFADSVFAVAAEGRRFSGNPLYPNAQADLEHSIAAIASLKCDVLISAHPELSGLWERQAKATTLGHVGFIDPNACRAYADKGRAFLAETLAKENAATPGAAPPYVLPDTEVLDLHAGALNRDYQVYVALPESYRTSNRRYPVIFVVDANYGFPVVRAIADRLHKHARLEEAIVVGLSYAKGDSPTYSRRRDYTPSVPRAGGYTSDMAGRQVAFGQADAYGRFISEQVFPLVAARYRADMGRKIFVGHSYGSLLGVELLLTRPETFDDYILGSPSLWFDGGVLFERERAYARAHQDLRAAVYFGIGGLETLPAGQKRSRAEEDADMVADLREFEATLRSHHYPGLKTRLEVFAGEDHASVFPILLTHGLRAYLHTEPRSAR